MRKLLFIFFISFCSSTVFAQPGCVDCNPDSLSQRLKGKLSETERLYTLVALMDGIITPATIDSAIHCIDQITHLNAHVNLVNTRPQLLIRDGLVLWKANECDSAISKFKAAISAFDEQKKIFGSNSILNT